MIHPKPNAHFTVQHLLIVDMYAPQPKEQTDLISRVNDTLDSITQSAKKYGSQQHYVTIMTITSGLIRCICHNINIHEVTHFNQPTHIAHRNERLFDAIGGCIATWRALESLRPSCDSHQVSIFSDGLDHGSKKYTFSSLRSVISALIQDDWKFTLVGSSIQLQQIAEKLGIYSFYRCRPPRSTKERNFLINQLKKQWRLRQISTQNNQEEQVAA